MYNFIKIACFIFYKLGCMISQVSDAKQAAATKLILHIPF